MSPRNKKRQRFEDPAVMDAGTMAELKSTSEQEKIPVGEVNPTAEERKLFDMLLNAAKHTGLNTVVRVAGGWVRDKLLGLGNDDIDIAVDNTSGVQFANAIRAYLEEVEGMHVKISVIQANPEQSKHLETACLRVLNYDLDVVNLRTEKYLDGSRIPTIETGTPMEDALRRDFTMNSLFYNLNTGLVEDFTNLGLSDLLTDRFLRTPLAPKSTFLDDPLRILRAVRFAVRFQFTIDPLIIEAAQDPDVVLALREKVSKERVGKEFEGMLSGRAADFPTALSRLHQMRLLPVLFDTGADESMPNDQEWERAIRSVSWASQLIEQHRVVALSPVGRNSHSNCSQASKAAAETQRSQERGEVKKDDPADDVTADDVTAADDAAAAAAVKSNARLAQLGCLLHLFSDRTSAVIVLSKGKKKSKPKPAVQFIVSDLLKFKNQDASACDVITRARSQIDEVVETIDEVVTSSLPTDSCVCPGEAAVMACGSEVTSEVTSDSAPPPSTRLRLGQLLRGAKDLWRPSLVAACAWELGFPAIPEGEDSIILKYRGVSSEVARLGLDGVWGLKPLVNGKEVIQVLELPKGPMVGRVMEAQVIWQLTHPEGTKEECVEYLLSQVKQGTRAP